MDAMIEPGGLQPGSMSPLALGWREWLSLPELGVPAIRAKVDSGARSSSLHVLEQELFERDGVPLVRFTLEHGRQARQVKTVEAQVVAQRIVTDSGGHRQIRIFIRTLLQLPSGQAWPIDLNLTQRRHMLFPMLLGRTALGAHCVVEPSRSFLLGRPPRPEPRQ